MGKFLDIWDRKKDGSRKELRSFGRTMIVALTLAVFFLFLKKDNVLRWVEAGFTIRRQNKEMEMNARQIEQMQQTLESLTTNRDSLEKFARERYHFAEKGDDIYLIP